ncbi:MAG TPA: C45 family peptidase [Thermoanaerobaculia bacterium]|nr:C45 family peptidase [Thermoanaerobaculia bacterium]
MWPKRTFAGALLAVAVSCAPIRPVGVAQTRPADRMEESGPLRRLGHSYLRWREDVLEARFAGGPYARGYARGRVAYPELVRAEETIHELIGRFVPSALKRFLLGKIMAVNLRESIPKIPVEHHEEIAGLSDALRPDPFPNEWNPFARHLALHALHDFSQRYVDGTPLAAACTGFAASGRATANRHTLMARNFDFEAGDLFDREKIVAYVVPDHGIPYLSVTIGGLTGVTSGFNRQGIGIAIHAWSGGPTASAGEPATLVAADVLEHAATLAEAIAIIQRASVFVSDIYLLADGKTGELAAVEKTPQASAVRRERRLLLVANHPETADFARAGSLNATSTSLYRRRRLEELVLPLSGRLGPLSAARVLRDRRGLKGKDIGAGNRNAVNGLIASHSVVFDLTARRAWVAAAPHGLGPFVAYSLDLGIQADPGDARFQRLSAAQIPPDPWLSSGGYSDFQSARWLLSSGRRALAKNDTAQAIADASAALALSPGYVEALALRAEASAAAGRLAAARADCEAALARDPSPPTFARSLEAFREALEAGVRPAGRLAYAASASGH